jgi:hypothetical protein
MSDGPYKRNQIEEAIALTLNEAPSGQNRTIKTWIKRLLDVDRHRGQRIEAGDPEESTFAFFTEEAQGSGVQVMFSAYEAFAVLQALKLMNHNWTQEVVVSLLRAARSDLERCHARILRTDPSQLFAPELIRQRNQNGNYVATSSDPHFLLIVSDAKIRDEKRVLPYAKVFRGEIDAFRFMLKEPGRSATWFELVQPACELQEHLNQTQPSKRGRSR